MVYTPDRDLDDILIVLNPFIESHVEGSKEREALALAQIALLYIRDKKMQEDFAKYCEGFTNKSFTVEVSHEFATREEADAWRASGHAKHTERVKIAGKGFMVVEVTGRLYFMRAPLPEELETDEWMVDEPVEVSHEFATREEADKWLASGEAKDAERVKIAGKGFMVVELGRKLFLMPLPEELDADEGKDDSE